VAQELPDVCLRVQFRAFGRRRDQRDIGPDDQGAGEMPSGLIDQKRHVRTRHDLRRDLGEVRFIARVSHLGMTSAAFVVLGEIAPKRRCADRWGRRTRSPLW
jgi:hypothetical protein